MTLVAVRVGLDQARAVARSCTGEGLPGDLLHGEQIIAVHSDPWDGVSGGPLDKGV